MSYNPYYQNLYQQYQQYQMPQQQGSTIIHVQSEAQAREWAVAPNSSTMFIDDTAPYCYTKSMGASQFEPPVFKRFKIIEDTPSQSAQNTQEVPSASSQVCLDDYMTKAEFEPFKALLERIEKELFSDESVK